MHNYSIQYIYIYTFLFFLFFSELFHFFSIVSDSPLINHHHIITCYVRNVKKIKNLTRVAGINSCRRWEK
jgi:hypothetical protein